MLDPHQENLLFCKPQGANALKATCLDTPWGPMIAVADETHLYLESY